MSFPSPRVGAHRGWRGLAFALVAVAVLTGCPRKPAPPKTPPPTPPVTVPPARATEMVTATDSAVTPVIASAARPWDAVAQRHLFEGHRDTVLSVAFSPAGTHVLSGSADGTARLWDLNTRKSQLLHHADGYAVLSVAFSADGKQALVGDSQGTVVLHDVAAQKRLRSLAVGAAVAAVAFSPDARLVYTASVGSVPGAGVQRWDAATGVSLGFALLKKGLFAAAFTPDGRRVAVSGPQGAELHDLEPTAVATAFRSHLLGLAPVGDQTLGCSVAHEMELWAKDARRGKFMTKDDHIVAVAQAHDGRRGLSGTSGGLLELWNLDQPDASVKQMRGHTGAIRAIAFSADGRRAVTGSADRTVRVWDLDEGRELWCLGEIVEWEVWSVDRRWVLVRGYPVWTILYFWDVIERREVWRLEGHTTRIIDLVLSFDNKLAASVSEDGTILVWDLATGRQKVKLPTRADLGRRLLFSTDGRYLLSTEPDRMLALWDVTSGTEVRRFVGPELPVTTFTVSADTTRLLLGSERVVLVWDATAGREMRRFTTPGGSLTSLTLSPDGGQVLATTSTLALGLWEVESGRELGDGEERAKWVTEARTRLVRQALLSGTTTVVRRPVTQSATTTVATTTPAGDNPSGAETNPMVSGTISKVVQALTPGTTTTETVPQGTMTGPGTTNVVRRTTTIPGTPTYVPGPTTTTTTVPGGTTTTYVPRSTSTYVPRTTTTYVPRTTTTYVPRTTTTYTTRTIIIRRR